MSSDSPSIPFDQTPEFRHFKDTMRRVLAVPKAEVDKLLEREHKKKLMRKNKPHEKQNNREQ
jgi:hypothetical protein